MFGLPKSTEFNKRVPKEKFYENLSVTPAIRKSFINQIKAIYWRNKIAASTTNLAEGKTVTEIEVFEIKLKSNILDEAVLRQIDREIPYHILFLLEYEGKYQAFTAYKEASAVSAAFKVSRYYHSDWMDEEKLPLKLAGLSVDEAYENFVRQIAGERLKAETPGESLKFSVARDEQKQALQKQINILETKIRKETQLNRQIKMNDELKELKRKLEAI